MGKLSWGGVSSASGTAIPRRSWPVWYSYLRCRVRSCVHTTAMDCHGNYLAVFHSVGAYCSIHFTRMVSELFYALDISVFLHLFAICFSWMLRLDLCTTCSHWTNPFIAMDVLCFGLVEKGRKRWWLYDHWMHLKRRACLPSLHEKRVTQNISLANVTIVTACRMPISSCKSFSSRNCTECEAFERNGRFRTAHILCITSFSRHSQRLLAEPAPDPY